MIDPKEKKILSLMAAMGAGLEYLGKQGGCEKYRNVHFPGLKAENGALVMLTASEDGKTHFQIEVRIWKEDPISAGEPGP